ncbi:hypothetical protein [Halomicrococcus sp. SG-WS-1]|uniref:hypothetical protein n=1 Tax=Halomicrococcus sp. SG-WS-1 TaxID=3439057 RepID=UPI003F795E50
MALEDFRTPPPEPNKGPSENTGSEEFDDAKEIVRDWLRDNSAVLWVNSKKIADDETVQKRAATHVLRQMDETERWSGRSAATPYFRNPYYSGPESK